MPSIVHAYTAGDTVFHVNTDTGVREALVTSVNINIKASGTVISYVVAFKKAINGSDTVVENTLYPDVDAALLAYKPLVDVP